MLLLRSCLLCVFTTVHLMLLLVKRRRAGCGAKDRLGGLTGYLSICHHHIDHKDCHGIMAVTALPPPNFLFSPLSSGKEILGEVAQSLTKSTIEHNSTGTGTAL